MTRLSSLVLCFPPSLPPFDNLNFSGGSRVQALIAEKLDPFHVVRRSLLVVLGLTSSVLRPFDFFDLDADDRKDSTYKNPSSSTSCTVRLFSERY